MYYVVLDVNNRIREDVVLYWSRGSAIIQRLCQSFRRCVIAFKIQSKKQINKSIDFYAVSRDTNRKLLINNLDFIPVTPMHYRNIVYAVVDYSGECHFPISLFLLGSIPSRHSLFSTVKCDIEWHESSKHSKQT